MICITSFLFAVLESTEVKPEDVVLTEDAPVTTTEATTAPVDGERSTEGRCRTSPSTRLNFVVQKRRMTRKPNRRIRKVPPLQVRSTFSDRNSSICFLFQLKQPKQKQVNSSSEEFRSFSVGRRLLEPVETPEVSTEEKVEAEATKAGKQR